MRLVTFTVGDDVRRLGALSADGVVDLQRAHNEATGATSAEFASMQALIDGGDSALDLARQVVDETGVHHEASEVTLLAPLPDPIQIRDCMCFETHLINAYTVMAKARAKKSADPEKALAKIEKNGIQIPQVFYQQPLYYKANRFSVIGPETEVKWPRYARLLDYELEFAAVIGKRGVDISKADAPGHIFGYTIFNDVSARDAQGVEMVGQLGPAKGKDFDTGNVFGPCIVTADSIDPYNLNMTARINGEQWSNGHSGTMHWRFDDVIAHISQAETLYPGEILGSGTVGGGCGLEFERYLSPGDLIELEVEGIGVLRNRIVQ